MSAATMTDTELFAYYRAHSVAGDCTFALRPDTTIPEAIAGHWRGLQAAVRDTKETAGHRREAARLRTLWRTWTGLRAAGRETEAGDYLATIAAIASSAPVKAPRAVVNWRAKYEQVSAELAALRAQMRAI
jgi:5'-deoxynucleotidase YfbR-like HD superfamily hydrolase